jgi:hypothetical protein
VKATIQKKRKIEKIIQKSEKQENKSKNKNGNIITKRVKATIQKKMKK